jgi:hypothetical protein
LVTRDQKITLIVKFKCIFILGAVIYFGYGIRFSNLEVQQQYSEPQTYKVGLDLDADFDPNFCPDKPTKTSKGGYQEFQNEE